MSVEVAGLLNQPRDPPPFSHSGEAWRMSSLQTLLQIPWWPVKPPSHVLFSLHAFWEPHFPSLLVAHFPSKASPTPPSSPSPKAQLASDPGPLLQNKLFFLLSAKSERRKRVPEPSCSLGLLDDPMPSPLTVWEEQARHRAACFSSTNEESGLTFNPSFFCLEEARILQGSRGNCKYLLGPGPPRLTISLCKGNSEGCKWLLL